MPSTFFTPMLSTNNRLATITYWLVSVIVIYIVPKIMIIPADSTEYFVNKPIYQLIFTKGETHMTDLILFNEFISVFFLVSERYSCLYDLLYLVVLRLLTIIVPILIMTITSYALNLIDYNEFYRLST